MTNDKKSIIYYNLIIIYLNNRKADSRTLCKKMYCHEKKEPKNKHKCIKLTTVLFI